MMILTSNAEIGQILDIARDAIMTIIKSSAPLLVVSLVVGLLISIFQTITSIQDQTLTFVPKILAVFVTLMVCGSWIMNQCVEFFEMLIQNIWQLVR